MKVMNTPKLLVNPLIVALGTMINVGLQLDKILVTTKQQKVHTGAQLGIQKHDFETYLRHENIPILMNFSIKMGISTYFFQKFMGSRTLL